MAHQEGRSKTSSHSLNASSIPHPQNIAETGGIATRTLIASDKAEHWQCDLSKVWNNGNETNSVDSNIPLS